MKIICECDGVCLVESEKVVQIELSRRDGDTIRAVLLERIACEASPNSIIMNEVDDDAILHLPLDDWLLEIIEGGRIFLSLDDWLLEITEGRIFLSKDHPSFDQVIDLVKLQQTLS